MTRDMRAGVSLSVARRRAQTIVDRLAQPFVRHRHHRNRRRARGIQRAQMREQIGGRFDEVGARAKGLVSSAAPAAPWAGLRPKASRASPGSTWPTSRRSRVRGA